LKSSTNFRLRVADGLIAGQNSFRVFRRHRDLSQTDLARSAGISVPYLNQIEAGKREPRTKVVKALAGMLNVPIDALVGKRVSSC
jgi:transcriptional regulator with XRE-family HTH domain